MVYHLPKGDIKVLGYDEINIEGAMASFINAYNAHSLELDDGNRFGMIHLGATIISSILSVYQQFQLDIDKILSGIIIGYEAAVKIAKSIQPSHKKKGFHTSGTCGVIGSAVACSFSLGFSKSQLKRAITAAVASSSGLLEIQENNSEMKPYNLANAAKNGYTAAIFGGFTEFKVPEDILGGKRGFLRLFSDNFSYNEFTENSDYFEIENVYFKKYASCRHCHSAIEAIIAIKNDVDISQIKKIEVNTYDLAVEGHSSNIINNSSSAKLSIPYSVAIALLTGECSLNSFDEINLKRKDLKELIRKIEIKSNDDFSKLFPKKRIAKVRVIQQNNQFFENIVEYAKGDPENPMSKKEVIDKFYALMNYAGQAEKAKKICNWLNLTDVEEG